MILQRPRLGQVHRQPDQTVCAGRSIGERGPEVEGGKLTHLGPAPVLVQGRREEGHIKRVSAAGLDNLFGVSAV